MTVATDPVEFDPLSDDYFNDPTEIYRRLRDEAPVYFSERYGFYALSRFADVLAAHRDWEGFSSAHGIELFTFSKDPEEIAAFRSIIMMDPPEHDRFRALVSRVFTPRAVAALEPMIREVIGGYLDQIGDASEFDAVADFSAPFPVEVIARLLGVPEGERQQIRHWLDLSLHREPGQVEPSPENEAAVLESAAYFYELTTEKRKQPRRRHALAPHPGDGRPRRRHRDRARRRRDHRLRDPPRRCGRRDRHEARRQRRHALLAAPRPVAEDRRRPRARSRGPSTRSSATCRRRSTRVATASRSASSRAARSPPVTPCS